MITGHSTKRDTDWKCPECKHWRRAATSVCKCGHIPRTRITRKERLARQGQTICDYAQMKHGLKPYKPLHIVPIVPADLPYDPSKDLS